MPASHRHRGSWFFGIFPGLCVLLLHALVTLPASAADARTSGVVRPQGGTLQHDGSAWLEVERPRIRGGAGFDLGIAGLTRLHLDVVPARDPSVRGWRWKHRLGDISGAWLPWSIGAAFDVVRSMPDEPLDAARERHPYRDRRLVVSPQFLLDLDRVAGFDGCAELRLQHAYWRGPGDLAGDRRTWQVELRWRF